MTMRWRRVVVFVAILLPCLVVGLFTVRPTLTEGADPQLASNFGFEKIALNSAPANARTERSVASPLRHIQAWMSAVGAAVGLADLRGTGRSGDACLVDPRDDSVSIIPVPSSGGPAYLRFVLNPAPLRYDATMAPMGCVPADLDENGSQDLLVYYWGRSPILFLNQHRPDQPLNAAEFRPVELVSPAQVWNTSALNVGDIDGDGHLDVLVGNYFPDGAKVLDPAAPPDGRIAMQDSMGKARNGGVNRLLLTRPTGTPNTPPEIVDASTAFSDDSARSWTLAFGLQQMSGSGVPDVYVANDYGPDQLLVNTSTPGNVRFNEVRGNRDLMTPRSETLGYDSFKGMGVTFTYSEGIGLPTVLVSNITTPYALQESNLAFVPVGSGADLLAGHSPFAERSEELGLARTGWAWDIKAGDFDNSGSDELMQATGFLKGDRNRWPELHELAMGNDELLRYPAAWPVFQHGDDLAGHQHNPLLVRNSSGRYVDVAERAGIADPVVSRGLAVGDVDGDGRLDVLVANQWGDSTLLRNTSTAPGKAADVRVMRGGAAGGAVPAIGAEIEWQAGGRPQKTQLYPANGHAGASAAEVHLALPDGAPTTAAITWRDGNGTRRVEVPLGPGHHTVELSPEGTAVAR